MKLVSAILLVLVAACEDGSLHKVPTSPDDNCDGLDNDLNGMVDDGYVSTGTCGVERGACTYGTYQCVKGEELCVGGVRPSSGPDVCDNIDTDCDGQVDEDHVFAFCDSEPLPLPCHPGILRCVLGEVVCEGRVPPMPAELCDGIDNDCNGEIDDLPPATEPPVVDIVFMFDLSGSNNINLIRQTMAIRNWVASFPPDWDYHFWIIEVSGVDYEGRWGANPIAHTSTSARPLPHAEFFSAGLDSLPDRDSGGIERYYDALTSMASMIAWRETSTRFIVAFFDEDNRDSTITEEEASMQLTAAGIIPIIFAGARYKFQRLVSDNNGELLPLNLGSAEIEDKLELYAVPPCRQQ